VGGWVGGWLGLGRFARNGTTRLSRVDVRESIEINFQCLLGLPLLPARA
jgi:hypothetical protein